MKKLLTLILICLSGSVLFAQAKVEVTGQVKDAQTKEILEFCSIAVFNSKDSLITGTVTDDKGFFALTLKRGNYHFVIRFIGYKTDTTKPADIMENKFLGVFKLKPDEKFLKEVSVTTSSHDNLIDRDEQIVTDKLREGASDTKDVLDKLHGVSYDRFSNSIKVDNSDKVMILVDGLEKDQEYIKNLSPDRLKKIEIIRDPGGRYGLEGYSAVINIILKKDYQGTEFFFTNRSMTDADAVKKEYILVQNNLYTGINYVYNKLNLYSCYSTNYNNFNLQSADKKVYDNGVTIEKNFADAKDMNTKVKELFHSVTLGADYYINPKNTLSFESNVKIKPAGTNNVDASYNVINTLNGIAVNNFNSDLKNNSNNLSSYNSLFYEGKLDENNVFNSNFTYSNYNNRYSNLYSENLLNKTNEEGTDNKSSTKFYLEYLHTFKNKTSLQIGYGNTWEKQNNNYIADASSSVFKYSDVRNKLYSYYSWQWSKKFSVKFGGASEASSRDANGQKNSYLIFQPYADIQYKPSELFNIKVKYRAESDYPNISQTNPFTTVIDLQSVKTGNPYLSPELMHKVSMQANVLNGLVTVEPYYHFSSSYITETGTLRSDSIFQYSYSNAGDYKNYGVEGRFTVPLGKGFYLKSDFDIYKSSIKYADKINYVNDWTAKNQLIYQNSKSGLTMVLEYRRELAMMITAQGWDKGGANDYWIFLIQKPFFKQKLNLMFLYFLPINSGVDYNQGNYIKTDNYTETKSNDISFLKNMIMLQVSYRFNKGKSVNVTEKKIEQDNEKNSKSVF